MLKDTYIKNKEREKEKERKREGEEERERERERVLFWMGWSGKASCRRYCLAVLNEVTMQAM